METIIKKAIEGGWIRSPYHFEFKEILRDGSREATVVIRFIMEGGSYKSPFPSDSFYSMMQVFGDSNFWQALAKECGWEEHTYYLNCPLCGDIPDGEPRLFTWKYHALRFHEINLTEGWDKAVTYLDEVTRHPAKA